MGFGSIWKYGKYWSNLDLHNCWWPPKGICHGGKPKKIFLLIGVNDLFFHDPSYVLKHYETILQNCKSNSPNTTLIVQSLLPVNKTIKDVRINNKDIEEVNEGIKKLAAKYNRAYLDLNSHFKDGSGKLNGQFSVDGIHINGRGYSLWRDLVVREGLLGEVDWGFFLAERITCYAHPSPKGKAHPQYLLNIE